MVYLRLVHFITYKFCFRIAKNVKNIVLYFEL